MKRALLVLSLLIASTMLAVQPAAAAEVAVNGGFEVPSHIDLEMDREAILRPLRTIASSRVRRDLTRANSAATKNPLSRTRAKIARNRLITRGKYHNRDLVADRTSGPGQLTWIRRTTSVGWWALVHAETTETTDRLLCAAQLCSGLQAFLLDFDDCGQTTKARGSAVNQKSNMSLQRRLAAPSAASAVSVVSA